MRPINTTVLIVLLFFMSCTPNQEKSPVNNPHEARENALADMESWSEARFGMFVHWGVYSNLGGIWHNEAVPGYSEHIMRKMEIPLEVYKKEVAGKFNPIQFDAAEWIRILKNAGMHYLVITAKHHDGFAMFDSDVTDYNIVDGSPFNRDPMKELREECSRQGVLFGFYYSHAQDWSHPYGQRNTWDFNHPTERGVWFNKEEWREHREKTRIYVEEKSIPQLEELILNYDPDILWFDTKNWIPEEYNVQILEVARRLKPELIINSRSAEGFANYQTTCDKPEEFPPVQGYWEAIPTTNESYGYHAMDNTHKSSSHFIRLLAKSSARGGNLLMNVGPMGNGKIDPKDVEILQGIGDWLAINGESIYGATRTRLPVNAWGESTIKDDKLYLHVFNWPKNGELIIGGLQSDIDKAYFLSDPLQTELAVFRINEQDLILSVPPDAPDSANTVIAIQVRDSISCDRRRLISNTMSNTLHAFDGWIEGRILRYGKGNHQFNRLIRWERTSDFIQWDTRLNAPGTFEVYLQYDAASTMGGEFEVSIGGERLSGQVKPDNKYMPHLIGRISLGEGSCDIAVKAKTISGDELMAFRSLTLVPLITEN